jgi:hypothetical protein
MRQEWSSYELVGVGRRGLAVGWQEDRRAPAGFALLLKDFEIEARFPPHAGEAPPAAVAYMAEQIRVPAEES